MQLEGTFTPAQGTCWVGGVTETWESEHDECILYDKREVVMTRDTYNLLGGKN